jgi:uncharacterized damage-inducible protein DinB
MARYNAWQNRQLTEALDGVSLEVLRADQGAVFGSILGTLNHVLWGDRVWMHRFAPDRVEAPGCGLQASPDLCATFGVWSADRFAMDGRIRLWADRLHAVDLTGDMTWVSGALGREVSKPLALCVVHMFNHQTHHRGQTHAMLTAAGAEGPVSDLFAMPQEGPWL